MLTDFFTDLRDGTHLLSLLEVLSGLSLVSTDPEVIKLFSCSTIVKIEIYHAHKC